VLLIQSVMLSVLLIFSVIEEPSTDPHGSAASIAAIIAVSTMAWQCALMRLTLPVASSTAAMTGNLTNLTLAFMDENSRNDSLMVGDIPKLKGSLHLLIGFS
jgi:uncharacterized membrane protein YoaK (UPF0700 family)